MCLGYFKAFAQVIHTIPNTHGSVTGITMLNNQLYTSHSGNSNIAVYCPATFQFQQYLNWYCQSCRGNQSGILDCCCYQRHNYGYGPPELKHLVACSTNNCVYVSVQDASYSGNHICIVALDKNTLSLWSVGGLVPLGLSITGSHNLLVVLSILENNYLNEYSTDGQLIREISLQPAVITNPIHVVQLSNDQFGVTHHGPSHLFSIVSSNGQQLVQGYRGDAGDMDCPQGIAVDQRGRIFVADQNNNRILVMDSETLTAYTLPLSTVCKLDRPYSIHFDAVNRRLYIGELNAGRIVCCQL